MPTKWSEIDGCEICPFYTTYCNIGSDPANGGLCGAYEFNPDDLLDSLMDKVEEDYNKEQDRLDKMYRLEDERQDKLKLAKEKRQKSKQVVRNEDNEIKALRKRILANKRLFEFQNSMREAFNFASSLIDNINEKYKSRPYPFEEEDNKNLKRIEELLEIKREKLKILRNSNYNNI